MGYEEIILIVGVAVIAIALIVFLITFLVYKKQTRIAKVDFKETKNSLRVFVLDIKNGECLSFNRSNLSRKKRSSITEFYNEFPSEEREKLILWIGSLLDPNTNEDQYLDINVLVNKNKKKYFSMLLVEKIDLEKQIIHIDSYLLKYMTKHNMSTNGTHLFMTKDRFTKVIRDSKQNKGITFCLNFYNLRPHYNNHELTHLAFTRVKDLLLPYISKEVIMHEYSDHQILISNLPINTRYASIQFTNTLKNEISKLLTLYSLSDILGFNVGAIENKLFKNDVDTLINNVVSIAEIGKEDNEFIIWYQQGMKLEDMADSQYRTEVERIIRDKKLNYLYRPIYNTTGEEILGYESIVKPVDTFFDSLTELKRYAAKTEDDKELFSTISRNAISRFICEMNKVNTIFFPVSFQETLYIFRTFGHIQDIKNANVVVKFDEQEFVDLPTGQEDAIINHLRQLKSRGYEVAMELNDSQLTLPHEVYAMADYFIIDASFIGDKSQNDAKSITLLHGLIERLLPFKKKIITINIANWSAVELVMKLGIEYISGEIIGPSDQMVLPLSPKSIKKISAINV
ncbi:MAG: EAL domain-containing protein [Bacilli bacterium]|nr:EAL domain-containing protein [Bacilli bacterium]